MDIKHLRRERLNELVEKMGGQKSFVEASGLNQGLASRILTGKKPIGYEMARSIEKSMGWPDKVLEGGAADPMEALQLAIDGMTWLPAEEKAHFVRQMELWRKLYEDQSGDV